MAVAHPARRLAGDHPVQRLVAEHRDLGVEQCHVDMGASAGPVALAQCGEDRDRRIEAGEQIRISDTAFLRSAVRLAGQRHGAAHRLDDEIVAGARRIGPGLSKAGDRAIDEPGIDRRERLVIEAVSGEAARLEILDQNVGRSGEGSNLFLPAFRSKIDRQRGLAAVAGMKISRVEVGAIGAGDEGRSPLARIVAGAGPLYLDHFGAKVGKQLPRPWTGEDSGDLDHAQAGEGLVQFPIPSSRRTPGSQVGRSRRVWPRSRHAPG